MSDIPEFSTQTVLELACAAQRVNGSYIKDGEAVYDDDNNFLYIKPSNKNLILVTLDSKLWNGDPKDMPFPLKITQEDKDQAEAIKLHYRKLMFAAIAGDNDFQTSINSILGSEQVPLNKFGYVACLPSVYHKDFQHTQVKRASKKVEDGYLGEVDSWVTDLDCEVLECIKSKNFEGYNICATINNLMTSWISKKPLTLGPCVIVKAKVKDHSKHWKHENAVTRLNYVKAAQ